jgi:hypothetical protein
VRHLFLAIALFGTGLLPAHAIDSPAQMVTGKRSIEELLNIPEELKPGRYTLNCGVLIGTSGWVLFARCYPRVGSAPTDLQKAVMYAAKTALFEPATRNGKRVEVFTTLTVKIDTTMSEPLILAVANDGSDAGTYGPLYTAPQRYGGSRIKPPLRRPQEPLRAAVVWIELQIDEQGAMTKSKVINTAGAPQWWVDTVDEATKKMTFIPGYHDGKPVPMQFVQPMLWWY